MIYFGIGFLVTLIFLRGIKKAAKEKAESDTTGNNFGALMFGGTLMCLVFWPIIVLLQVSKLIK